MLKYFLRLWRGRSQAIRRSSALDRRFWGEFYGIGIPKKPT